MGYGLYPAVEDSGLAHLTLSCGTSVGDRFHNEKIVSTEARTMRGAGTE
jgi:hypothetical protein